MLAYLCLWCRKQASLGMAGSRTMPCSVLHQDYIIEGITNRVVAACRHYHEADHQSLERTVAAILHRRIRLTLTTLLHRNALHWQRGYGLPTIYPRQRPVCYSCVSGQSSHESAASLLFVKCRVLRIPWEVLCCPSVHLLTGTQEHISPGELEHNRTEGEGTSGHVATT